MEKIVKKQFYNYLRQFPKKKETVEVEVQWKTSY